ETNSDRDVVTAAAFSLKAGIKSKFRTTLIMALTAVTIKTLSSRFAGIKTQLVKIQLKIEKINAGHSNRNELTDLIYFSLDNKTTI
ncbi:hypothetical protein ACXO7U_09745, partial [Lactobacillus delbrueckii subsp. bulgaricus]